jgi:hypothetical protein
LVHVLEPSIGRTSAEADVVPPRLPTTTGHRAGQSRC